MERSISTRSELGIAGEVLLREPLATTSYCALFGAYLRFEPPLDRSWLASSESRSRRHLVLTSSQAIMHHSLATSATRGTVGLR